MNKPVTKKSIVAMIWLLVSRYPGRCALSATLLLIVGMTEGLGVAALLPLLGMIAEKDTQEDNVIGQYFERMYEFVGFEPSVGGLLIVIVALITLKAALSLLAMAQVGYASAYVAANERLRLLRSHAKAAWSHFSSLRAGQLAAAIGPEARRVADNYVSWSKMIADFFNITVHLVLAAVISIQVTLASILVGAFTALLLWKIVRVTRRTGTRQTSLVAEFTARLVEGISGMKSIKAMGNESRFETLLVKGIAELQDVERRLTVYSRVNHSLQEPIMVAALATGIYFLLESWGDRLDVLLVLGLLFARSVQSINGLQKSFQNLASREGSFWFVGGMVDAAEKAADLMQGEKEPTLESSIDLRDLSFSYPGSSVLRNVDLSISAGYFTAITGSSGAGKTTIVDLVIGLHRPQSGEVWIDGLPLGDIKMSRWRSMIGYVPQETFLFHDTVRTNVSLGEAAYAEAEVVQALKAAGAWDFVSALPEGVDTVVGEKGGKLSGGQRQRIAIARALVRKPKLLILDEATTALDPATEEAICQTLKGLTGDLTILAISHQPQLVEAADFVSRIKDGEIVEMVKAGPSDSNAENNVDRLPVGQAR